VSEAGGTSYLEESKLWPATQGRYVTTHLVSSVRFQDRQPELLARFVAAHVELTQWIQAHPTEAQRLLNDELKAEMGRTLAEDIVQGAWSRLEFTYDPVRETLLKSAEDAHRIGFLRKAPDLSRIYSLEPLNDALRARQLPLIQ